MWGLECAADVDEGRSLSRAEARLRIADRRGCDEELDRVGDVDIVGSKASALGPGRVIMVHGMKGRSRGYAVSAPSAKSVLSLAFNNRCDVVVATVVAGDAPVAQEQAVLEFLNGDLVLHWAEQVLGL